MAPSSPFPVTTFQLANGDPLANGYLLLNLSKDVSTGTGQLSGKVKVKIQLDSNGEITGTPYPEFYPNITLTPSDSYYIVSIYTSEGERVAGPLSYIVGNTGGGFGQEFGVSFAS